MTHFDHTLEYEYYGDIKKFINYRVNYGIDHNPPVKTELLHNSPSSKIYKKIITTDIKNIPKTLLRLVGLDNITVEQFIHIDDNKVICSMEASEKYKKFLDFKETYECTVNGDKLFLKLRVWGKNHCPSGFKEMAINAYLDQRKSRIEYEINITKNISDSWEEDDIIQ